MNQIFIKNENGKIIGSIDPSLITNSHVIGTDESSLTIVFNVNGSDVQFRGLSIDAINTFYTEYNNWLTSVNIGQ